MSGTQLIIILAGILLLLLSISSLKMKLHYRRQGSDDHFVLKVSLWREIISYKVEVPLVKTKLEHSIEPRNFSFWPVNLKPAFKLEANAKNKNNPEASDNIKEEALGLSRLLSIIRNNICFIKNYQPAIKYFLGKLHLQNFQWITEFGMEEPHITGFLTGLAGGVKGLLLSGLYRFIHAGAARPTVVIKPKFEKPCFTTQIDCEFNIKTGYVLLTAIKFILLRIKG